MASLSALPAGHEGRRRGKVPAILGLSLTLAAVVSFAALDQRIISHLSRKPMAWTHARWVETFALLGKAWLLIWLLFVWVLVTRRRREVLTALLALIIIGISVGPLKALTGRPRPYVAIKTQAGTLREHHSAHYMSFPSGDTAVAVAVAASLAPTVGPVTTGLFVIACAGVGFLRITGMAHYPSDVFAGAAIGLLAAWLAGYLAERLERSGRLEIPQEVWLARIGIVTMPLVMGLSEGWSDLLVFLKSWGLVALCAVLGAKAAPALAGLSGRTLYILKKARMPVMVLAVTIVILENAADLEKPHELLPFDEPVAPFAVVGVLFVLLGVALRCWARGHCVPGRLPRTGPYVMARHPLYVGAFLITCGVLFQLHGWTNWLIVLPIFCIFYGAAILYDERSCARTFGELWQSYREKTPAVVPSLRSWRGPRSLRTWNWRTCIAGEAWFALLALCLPWLIEIAVEDFMFERILGA